MYDHTRQNLHICELNKSQSDFWLLSSMRLSTSRQHKTQSADDCEHFQRCGPNTNQKKKSIRNEGRNKQAKKLPKNCRSHGREIYNAFFCIKKSTPSTSRDVRECRSSNNAGKIFPRAGEASYVNQKLSKSWLVPRFRRFACSCLHQKPESAYEQGSSGRSIFTRRRKNIPGGRWRSIRQPKTVKIMAVTSILQICLQLHQKPESAYE